MFPVIVIAAATLPCPENPPTCLDDAYRFNVPGEVAHAGYVLARDHLNLMRDCITFNNSPEVAGQWLAEQEWRIRCWSDLEDVTYHGQTGEWGLGKLRSLRARLGEKDYWRGAMPSPLCSYAGWSR